MNTAPSRPRPRFEFDYEGAAEYLGLTVRQLRAAVKRGDLRHYRPGGNFVRFDREQLDEFLRSCEYRGDEPASAVSR